LTDLKEEKYYFFHPHPLPISNAKGAMKAWSMILNDLKALLGL
jgi:hypothetical protein